MKVFSAIKTILLVSSIFCFIRGSSCFSLVFMVRKGQGKLQQSLEESDIRVMKMKGAPALNQGKGQEVTGVTLPIESTIKGWEFGNGVRLVCCKFNGRYYAIQGGCPRCGFDLWKGDLIVEDEAWDDLPRVACPTCATTYSMRTGNYGPPIKRTGLQDFVSSLAKSATSQEANKSAKPYTISVDEDGRVFCL